MTTTATLARRLVAAAAITDALKAISDADRAAMQQAMRPGAAEPAYDDAEVLLGRVRMDAGKPSISITDPQALINWLAEHQPDALVTEVRIHPAVEAEIRKTGHVVDAATGEEVPAPGITLTARARLVVTKTDDAKKAAESLLESSLPALAASTDAA